MPRDVFVYPALSGYLFDAVFADIIAWDRQQFAVLGNAFVLVDDMLCHVQQADVRFHSRFLSACLYPQVPVEGNLQVLFREVRHVTPAQSGITRKKHQSKGGRNKENQTQLVVKQQFCGSLPL